MTEPWKNRQNDERKADTLPTFILFCEDEVCEPIYFKFFETSKIKINEIPNQDSKIKNVLNAIKYCEKSGFLEKVNDDTILIENEVQVWCVFDRDCDVNKPGEKIEFDESIKMAERKGFNTAWSNDAFELWILLHFEDLSPNDVGIKERNTYYNRLTTIFSNLYSTNNELNDIRAINNFEYKKHLKSKTNFRNIVRSEIVKETHTAIERAKKLENFYIGKNFLPHEKAPITMVHNLVTALLSTGGTIL